MNKQKLREAILTVLESNETAQSANDISIALSGEPSPKDLTACLKALIDEGTVERIEGKTITFALATAPEAAAEPSVDDVAAGIPAFLGESEESEPVLSDSLLAAFADLEAPKPVAHNAAVKIAVLDRLSALMDESIADVLGDIKNDLQQIAA